MKKLRLGEFISTVKNELLAYQKKYEGEQAYFLLNNVDLEVSLAVNLDGKGKINLAVVELGSDIAKETTHTVRLNFGILDAKKELRKLTKEAVREKFRKTGKPLSEDELAAVMDIYKKELGKIQEGGEIYVKSG